MYIYIKGTFLNEMVQFIQRNKNMIDIDVSELREYLVSNEYDSDAVKADLDGFVEPKPNNNGILISKTCNIYNKIKNVECIDLIKSYIRNIQRMFFFFLCLSLGHDLCRKYLLII